VWAMQKTLYAVQQNPETCSVVWLYRGTNVGQHSLYLAPVDVAANRAVKNGMQQVFVFVDHDNTFVADIFMRIEVVPL